MHFMVYVCIINIFKFLSTNTVELYAILIPVGVLVALLVISLLIIMIMALVLGKCTDISDSIVLHNYIYINLYVHMCTM